MKVTLDQEVLLDHLEMMVALYVDYRELQLGS